MHVAWQSHFELGSNYSGQEIPDFSIRSHSCVPTFLSPPLFLILPIGSRIVYGLTPRNSTTYLPMTLAKRSRTFSFGYMTFWSFGKENMNNTRRFRSDFLNEKLHPKALERRSLISTISRQIFLICHVKCLCFSVRDSALLSASWIKRKRFLLFGIKIY